MLGWMALVYVLSLAVQPNDPNVEEPTPVNLGVVVTPADGWYSASEVWEVGPTGIALQSQGAYVAFWAEEYWGTNQELLTEVIASLEEGFENLRMLPASATMVAGGTPGLAVLFSGVAGPGRVEGEVVVAARGGVGVVMWAEAQEGQLSKIQDDLEEMLQTMVWPR